MADELPPEGSGDGLELNTTVILQTENDILLRDELEDIAKRHPEQFVLWYTLDRPPKGRDTWKGLCSSLCSSQSFTPAPGDVRVMSSVFVALTLRNSSEINFTPHPLLKRDLSQVGLKKWDSGKTELPCVWIKASFSYLAHFKWQVIQ